MRAEQAGQGNPVIYFADDDRDDAYFIETAFREIDPYLETRHFRDGHDLLSGVNAHLDCLPAMVILDLNMPKLDGRETLRLLRETAGPQLPIVIFTNSNHLHEKEICFEYGATTFLTKPLSYPLYVKMLREVKEAWFHPQLAAQN